MAVSSGCGFEVLLEKDESSSTNGEGQADLNELTSGGASTRETGVAVLVNTEANSTMTSARRVFVIDELTSDRLDFAQGNARPGCCPPSRLHCCRSHPRRWLEASQRPGSTATLDVHGLALLEKQRSM